VAVAPGRIIVSDRTKVVQPLEAGVVRRILVKDGDHVSQGQLLVELDATLEQADGERLGEELAAASAELARAQALLAALASGRLPAQPIDGDRVSKASARSHGADAALTRSEWAEISAKLARLQSEAQRRRAELETARRAVERLSATLPLALQREQDIQSLSSQGFVAGHIGQDRTRERVELERDLATARAREAEVQAGVAESNQATVAFRAETLRALNERAAQARLRLAQLTQESTKSQQRARQTQLLAPATGTVQQLAVHTAGGVVTPAQPLLVVVPDNAQVTAEVLLENKDVGFVNPGQAASIKFETFPYTRYGTVDAQVTQITADAVADEKLGAVFPVRLRLGQEFLDIDGKRIGVAPGMNLTAEIRTGSRRVIDYLWSPLQRHAEESLRER
jgi:hemolysin D